MQITKKQLKRIIKEELEVVLEVSMDPMQRDNYSREALKGLSHDVGGAFGRYLRKLDKAGKRVEKVTVKNIDAIIAAFLKDPVGSKFVAKGVDHDTMKELLKPFWYQEDSGPDAYHMSYDPESRDDYEWDD